MKRFQQLSGTGSLLALCLILLTLCGCEDTLDFDKDSLFSLEDMARDTDYAVATIDMMERFRELVNDAVPHLGANQGVIPFDEAIPEGWSQNSALLEYREEVTSANQDTVLEGVDNRLTTEFYEELASIQNSPGIEVLDIVDSLAIDSTVTRHISVDNDTTYTKAYAKQYIVWVNRFYVRAHQDANTELVRFDYEIPTDENIKPRKVELMNYERTSIRSPEVPNIVTGDSLSIHYAGNFQNISELEGLGKYSAFRVVFFTQGSSEFARGAGMINEWYIDMTGISPNPTNPMGEFDFHGTTTINDLENMVVLQVTGSVSLRSNATGEAFIRVNGVERARIAFEGYDTDFHGYVLRSSDNFNQRIEF